jgi:tryptophan synthase alpha chain
MLDGPIIQAASVQALSRGVTVRGLLDELAGFDSSVPLVAMTYSNIVARHGYADFCARLVAAGVSGLIASDTPVDEVAALLQVSLEAGIELIMLVAPSTKPARVQRIAELGRGFIYAVSTMGVTGVRDSVSQSVVPTVELVRSATNLPVLVGFGISTPEQAVAVSQVSDGVAVGSALVRAILDGATPADLRDQVAAFRAGLDTFETA